MVVFMFQKLKDLLESLLFIVDVFYGINYQNESNKNEILRILKIWLNLTFPDLNSALLPIYVSIIIVGTGYSK